MADTNFQQLPIAVGIDGTEIVPIVQAGTDKRTTTGAIGRIGIASALPGAIEFLIDGGGGTIGAATWGYMVVPFNATLSSWTMAADQTGSITINVWKCTYTQFDPPTTPSASNDITNGHSPAITAAKKNQDTNLSDWTTVTLTEGDVLAFNVPSTATTISRVTLSLSLLRTIS